MMGMTFRELVNFARGAAIEAWNHTAIVLAMLHNCNRPENVPVAKVEDYHPYLRPEPVPVIKGDIKALKVFLTKRE